MFTEFESIYIGLCLEGFFYGLYSGIFVMYLYYASTKSKTSVIFYSLCLLYILSVATVISDLVALVVHLRAKQLPPQLRDGPKLMLYNLSFVQTTASGLCDFIAQCTLIYRCWIVWGKRKRVVIIPSFLAIAYLATWLAPDGATTQAEYDRWGNTVTLISFILSMVVNALATGLIVFKILMVFMEVEKTLTSIGSIASDGSGATLRHIIFVIIESGMALFVIQLIRVVVGNVPGYVNSKPSLIIAFDLVVGIHQMFNGITPTIILVRVSMGLSFNDRESLIETAESLRCNYPPSDSDPNTLGSSDTHEGVEDHVCLNDPSSDSSTLQIRQMGSTSGSMPPQEKSEDT